MNHALVDTKTHPFLADSLHGKVDSQT